MKKNLDHLHRPRVFAPSFPGCSLNLATRGYRRLYPVAFNKRAPCPHSLLESISKSQINRTLTQPNEDFSSLAKGGQIYHLSSPTQLSFSFGPVGPSSPYSSVGNKSKRFSTENLTNKGRRLITLSSSDLES